jgi:hypothetical protein
MMRIIVIAVKYFHCSQRLREFLISSSEITAIQNSYSDPLFKVQRTEARLPELLADSEIEVLAQT